MQMADNRNVSENHEKLFMEVILKKFKLNLNICLIYIIIIV